jgi:hypothetical protein
MIDNEKNFTTVTVDSVDTMDTAYAADTTNIVQPVQEPQNEPTSDNKKFKLCSYLSAYKCACCFKKCIKSAENFSLLEQEDPLNKKEEYQISISQNGNFVVTFDTGK